MATNPAYSDPEMAELQREAEARWGDSDAWRQSQERTKHWTKADYDRIKREGREFVKVLAAAMDHDPASPEVQVLVAQHRAGINTFYDCTDETYAGLAEMYIGDSRFTAYYDSERPGLAAFLREAMLISLRK
jgi:MerR family transcriptional regulator, thiopeptide resistance regulator